MRLTVRVLPLTADNAQGPHQADALAAFQQRVFALPVDADDTLDRVWRKIEDRYKNNYLAPRHAAFFYIKKLQDGRDCDLDLGDTVADIFGDEAPKDRVVQVVPSFANRLFSLPPETNLRPNPHKRLRTPSDAASNKRPRNGTASNHSADADPDSVANGPVQSVESDPVTRSPSVGQRAVRSQTNASVMLLSAVRHEQPEYVTRIKSESPELGLSPSAAPSAAGPQGSAQSPALKKPSRRSYALVASTPTRSASKAQVSTPSHPPQKNSVRRRAPSSKVAIPSSPHLKLSPKLRHDNQSRSSQKKSELRTFHSSSENKGVRKLLPIKTASSAGANGFSPASSGPTTPANYANLRRTQLIELLMARGLKSQKGGRRNKLDMIQRLVEYDEGAGDSSQYDPSEAVPETPQGTLRLNKSQPVSSNKSRKSAPNVHEPLQLDGEDSDHGEPTQQSPGPTLPVRDRSSVPSLPQESPTRETMPSRPNGDEARSGDAPSSGPPRLPSPSPARGETSNNGLTVGEEGAEASRDQASGLRSSQSRDVMPNHANRISLEPTTSPPKEAAPIVTSSPELGPKYYLNGESSIWKHTDFNTSEQEAYMADEQAVEELRGTQDMTRSAKAPESVDGHESKSDSSSRPNSTRSSPIASREPAQWLPRSPSPRQLDSDEDSGASRSQSPADSILNGTHALGQDDNDLESSESDEEHEGGTTDTNRTPSPSSPLPPTSAQPLRPSVVTDTQSSSSTQAPATQRPPPSAHTGNGVNGLFPSASQPLVRSRQPHAPFPSASQSQASGRGPRNTTVFTSLKAMLNNVRGGQSTARVPPASKPLTSTKTGGEPGSLGKKKLPSALLGDSDDDDEESRSNSSSSSSDDDE